ncbi:hypothetical protein [Peribacillus sp. NPDC096448]
MIGTVIAIGTAIVAEGIVATSSHSAADAITVFGKLIKKVQ